MTFYLSVLFQMKMFFLNHTEDALIEVTMETKQYPCNTDYITMVVITTGGLLRSCELMSVQSDSGFYTCKIICICPKGVTCTGLLIRMSNTHNINAQITEVELNIHSMKKTTVFWHKMYRQQYECSTRECIRCKILSLGVCIQEEHSCSHCSTPCIGTASPEEGSTNDISTQEPQTITPVPTNTVIKDSTDNDCVVNHIILSFLILAVIWFIISIALLSYYCTKYYRKEPQQDQRIFPSFV